MHRVQQDIGNPCSQVCKPRLSNRLSSNAKLQDFERHAMSEEVARSVPNEDVNKAISDLERLEPHGASPALLSCFRGPFGALRLSQTEKLEPIHMDTEVAPLLSRDWDDELEEILREDEFTFDNPAVQEIGQNESWMPQEPNLSQLENTSFGSIESQLQPQINIYGTNIESWTLLSHYKGQIVPLISPLRRGQETPWISLVIPCAVTTLGELTLNGQVNNARLALLNAVWSTSAFHLSNNTSWSGNWKASGEMYLQRAEYYFQKCMEETCLSTSKINKYKEILMAILSLSNAFVWYQQPFLLE
jgi:arginine metabolism regulation protein II